MRIAIISDTHFGDPMSTLVDSQGELRPGPKYEDFKNAAGKDNDYLILLGDVLDFSIAKYQDAYKTAKFFFLQIQEDKIAREIIFVPGNHDSDLWHTVEYQVNVINQLKKGKPMRRFRWSVPGIIDDRPNSPNRGFKLSGVTERTDPDSPKYAGLFLDYITEPEGESTYFNFAYPNVYMVTDSESILLTHGHYLETYWALAGEWAMKLGQEDLKVGNALSLKEMVGINFPLSQLACSGVGQAGPLTKVVQRVQREAKDGNLTRIKKYLNRLDNEIDKLLRYPRYKYHREVLTDKALDEAKKMVLKSIDTIGDTRYSEEFIHKKDVLNRFMNFYRASLIEINQLNLEYSYSIPMPWYVIFGHTHQPISWGAEDAPKTDPLVANGMQPVFLFNTGGWLYRMKDNKKEFCGAEVFTYSTDEGFKSVSVK